MDGLIGLDTELARAIYGIPFPPVWLSIGISLLGTKGLFLGLAGGGLVLLGDARRRRLGFASFACLASYVLFVHWTLKPWLGRVRPCVALDLPALDPLLDPASGSFPSGHTAAVFMAWALFGPEGRWSFWGFGLFALVTGFVRIHLGAHYPLDVLAGAAIGAGLGAGFRRLFVKNFGSNGTMRDASRSNAQSSN